MASKSTIQSVKIVNEPVMVDKDGKTETYIPKEIVGHREAYAASLHLLFKHVADFHVLTIEILAEKYGLSADDMIRTVQEDTRFQNMVVNPTIHAMQYFDETDVAKHVPVGAPEVAVAAAKKHPVIKKKAVAEVSEGVVSAEPAVAAVSEAHVVIPEAPAVIEKPKAKKPIIKKKVVEASS
jgi:hypothetical protein